MEKKSDIFIPPPTKWGWGRQSFPADVLAWNQFPWKIYFATIILIPAWIIGRCSGCNCFWGWILLFPLSVALVALPILAVALCLHSTLVCPAGPCPTQGQYFTIKDAAFKAKYENKKIPIEELYEAYFAEKLDFKGDLLEALKNRYSYARPILQWTHIKFFLTKLIPEALAHTRTQDVDQVREHYDRGDDFYEAFLGKTMVYTSGMFLDPENDDLEKSQIQKIDLVCNKIQLQKGDRHLDLGCGWGTFICHAAKNYGSDSTGVTLGKNQTQWANNKAKQMGVEKSARALCLDYRDTPREKWNKITCLEMAEHVGIKYFSNFLSQVSSMLEDDGIFYLQIAGLRRPWQFEDFTWGLFMGKYIFPGADASCPLGWVVNQLEGAGFEIHTVETIGIHYSATIKRWYDNWLLKKDYIVKKYGMRWYRLWEWFLAWSVISPEQGSASCYQIVCHKNIMSYDRKRFMTERTKFKV